MASSKTHPYRCNLGLDTLPKIFHIIVVLYGECIPYADPAIPNALSLSSLCPQERKPDCRQTRGEQGQQHSEWPCPNILPEKVKGWVFNRRNGKNNQCFRQNGLNEAQQENVTYLFQKELEKRQ